MFDVHAHIGVSTDKALVCTSRPEDFTSSPSFPFFSVGMIPEGESTDTALLEELLTSHPFQVGEVGLDRRFPDKERQVALFRQCIRLSKRFDRLLTIHYVGYTNELLDILREEKPKRFLVHGFTGSWETAASILRQGGTISLSPRAEKTKGFPELMKKLPSFVTESDLPTGPLQEGVLQKWNGLLSEIRQMDVEKESEQQIMTLLRG